MSRNLDAYKEGELAFELGLEPAENPYDPFGNLTDFDKWQEWREGWYSAYNAKESIEEGRDEEYLRYIFGDE